MLFLEHYWGLLGFSYYDSSRSSGYIGLKSPTASLGSILLMSNMKVRHRWAQSSPRTGSADSTLHEVVKIVHTVALGRRRLVLDIVVCELVHTPLDVACRLPCTQRRPNSLAQSQTAYILHTLLCTTSCTPQVFELCRLPASFAQGQWLIRPPGLLIISLITSQIAQVPPVEVNALKS